MFAYSISASSLSLRRCQPLPPLFMASRAEIIGRDFKLRQTFFPLDDLPRRELLGRYAAFIASRMKMGFRYEAERLREVHESPH